ncbi:MAG TPA: hypothetical protein VMV04_03155 [Thermodesulfobacteriota bacterium]|nr:hypothetical protein [Thermodesulfobacteriota bacterium]
MKRLNEDGPNAMKIEYFNRDFNRPPPAPSFSPMGRIVIDTEGQVSNL